MWRYVRESDQQHVAWVSFIGQTRRCCLAQSYELHCVRENTHLIRRIGLVRGRSPMPSGTWRMWSPEWHLRLPEVVTVAASTRPPAAIRGCRPPKVRSVRSHPGACRADSGTLSARRSTRAIAADRTALTDRQGRPRQQDHRRPHPPRPLGIGRASRTSRWRTNEMRILAHAVELVTLGSSIAE